MPSRDRFLMSFEPAADYLRRNPLTVIGGGAILCGAAVAAVILSASPHRPVMDQPALASGSVGPSSAIAKKVEPARPAPETTGQATPAQTADTRGAECETQTWPYISRSCLTRDDTGHRKVRVIATDQLSKPLIASIEAPRAQSDNKSVRSAAVMPKRDVAASGAASSEPVALQDTATQDTATVAMPLPLPRPAASTAVANNIASDPVQPALPVASVDPVAPQPVAAVATASRPATEAVRQPAAERPASAAERRAERRAERERARQARAEQRNARRGVHVVERWTERTYVAEDRFGESRRVVVIRRHGAPERGFEAYASSRW
jgi:hypothetical protein